MKPVYEPIVGRYLHLELLGKPHRLYFEEAGQGIPLLCLHTAGSDGRQFRGVLNDPDILRNFRVIVFDLPWHGKSSPPEGWQNMAEYRLTTEDYVDIIVGVTDALQLDRPVAMGCSIGGRVMLHLALDHPDRFSRVIGVQAGAFVAPYYDRDWLHRPDVHGGEVCAGAVSGLVSPKAPEVHRWETLWHYMQGGPGVFKGDLYFYNNDGGDIRSRLGEIDAKRCPVHLLTGEFDFSATPRDTYEIAAKIPGSEVTIMKDLGHFPMSENPEKFLSYLKPVLENIVSAEKGDSRSKYEGAI